MSNKTGETIRPATALDDAHAEELGHGNSPAAWTCVFVMLLGGLISSIAFVIGAAATWLFIVGIVIMLIGLGVGWAMRRAGYGVNGSKLKNAGH
ncbi:MAG: HGxxPAAW family protein [Actinomycetales bacterium]|jgi:predicted lipid-binding transport protein (Tim44 family)